MISVETLNFASLHYYMKKTVIIYGIVLALLVFVLEYVEYRYMVRNLRLEILISLISVIFVVLGWWLARKLMAPAPPLPEFEKNERAADYLGLSDRELEVLELVATGLSNKEIAEKLFVSVNTVKTHLKKVYEKLEVNRRTQAVEKAKSLNLIR